MDIVLQLADYLPVSFKTVHEQEYISYLGDYLELAGSCVYS